MPVMESVTLENFRCFREKQTVKLAPLTLLVGENSTGKTSFLALLRVLAELRRGAPTPDFKAAPFDLGSFDEIANFRLGRGGPATAFSIGFQTRSDSVTTGEALEWEALYTFAKRASAPVLSQRQIVSRDLCIEQQVSADGDYSARLATQNGQWIVCDSGDPWPSIPPLRWAVMPMSRAGDASPQLVPSGGSSDISEDDIERLRELARTADGWPYFHLPFASAPIRAKPRRTYDPARSEPEPEGDHIPMQLAEQARRNTPEWQAQKARLEQFGRDAGLFTELHVRLLGKSDRDPFQLQVRQATKKRKGPFRNLIDVGYGVNQVLPIVTELVSRSSSAPFLLQQPEVHLHPRAQAALGSWLFRTATDRHQIIVETHSDHLIDRVRMDVRDNASELNPDNVMMLYFERDELDVTIHEIRFDELGNVCGAPDSYGEFMMQETRRSLGL